MSGSQYDLPQCSKNESITENFILQFFNIYMIT